MKQAAKLLEFEQAALLRDKIAKLRGRAWRRVAADLMPMLYHAPGAQQTNVVGTHLCTEM